MGPSRKASAFRDRRTSDALMLLGCNFPLRVSKTSVHLQNRPSGQWILPQSDSFDFIFDTESRHNIVTFAEAEPSEANFH